MSRIKIRNNRRNPVQKKIVVRISRLLTGVPPWFEHGTPVGSFEKLSFCLRGL